MLQHDARGLRINVPEMNDSDKYICPDMLAMPVDGSTTVPVDVDALDIKPELLDLSENRQYHRQATKASQTEITFRDEFWNVCFHNAALHILV